MVHQWVALARAMRRVVRAGFYGFNGFEEGHGVVPCR